MVNLLRHTLLLVAIAFCYSTAQEQIDIVVQEVVVIPGANPKVAVIHWTPVTDARVAQYTIYYRSNTTGNSSEMSNRVTNPANSAIVSNLEIGHFYTFAVSIGLLVNGRLEMGPRSSSVGITTTRLTINLDKPADDGHSTSALVFYGCIIVLSMVVNLVLLVLSYTLLRQLRSKYSGSNTSSIKTTDSPIIELKTLRHSCHDDVPRKPAREHSPKEVFPEISNGRCTPAKQAEVEVIS